MVRGPEQAVGAGDRGVALLRYLAPTPEAFERADDLRQQATCKEQGAASAAGTRSQG